MSVSESMNYWYFWFYSTDGFMFTGPNSIDDLTQPYVAV